MIYSDTLRSETNPKDMAQAVHMTVAASGSTGITVMDNIKKGGKQICLFI